MSVGTYEDMFAAQASVDERADFIAKTYFHLLGAVLAFAGLEVVWLNTPFAEQFTMWAMNTQFGWFAVLGGFILVSYVSESWARSTTSLSTQYLGLGLYVFVQSIIFVPLLFFANATDPTVIPTAGVLTVLTFGGLTAITFATRKNFSFLGPFLTVASIAAFGVIGLSMFFQGLTAGIGFSAAMIVLASGYILYHTSAVMHEYRIGQHVAASLALFAAVALLFWYMVRIVLAARD